VPVSGPVDLRAKIRPTLEHWKLDPDPAAIRDAEQMANLPEPERATIKSLWDEGGHLIERLNQER
jgi:hypothetical protein